MTWNGDTVAGGATCQISATDAGIVGAAWVGVAARPALV